MLCHHVGSNSNSHNTSCTTHYKKHLVQFTSTHGITLMKKHIEHANEADLKQYMEKSKVAIVPTTIDATKQHGKK